MTDKLPATGSTPVASTSCDTADMVMFHRFLQSAFRISETLIERVPDGDVVRARRVSAHLADLAQNLHDHHAGEDMLLWDELEQRSPGCSVHVELMKKQHADMVVLLARLEAALPVWSASGSSADAATVMTALEDLEHSMDAHLAQEEKRILPIAGSTLAQKEWNRLSEHGRKSVPTTHLFTQLGMMLDSMSPEDRAVFLGELPSPVRLLWRLVGIPQYRRYLSSLGADPSPTIASAA